MNDQGRRVDGWKAIAAYLGRDRSTVIRWANKRGMPVHAVPGGTSNRTVFALADELDEWLRSPRALDNEAVVGSPSEQPAPTSFPVFHPRLPFGAALRRRSSVIAASALAVVVLSALAVVPSWRSPGSGAESPTLLRARDLVAERSAGSLAAATVLLERLTAATPGDARAHQALAEAALLNREFGAASDIAAFATARAEATEALRLDPGAAPAWRAVGYVRYWGDRRPREASDAFRRALALAPHDPLAHLWYANALADAGDDDAAAREMATARSLSPGQPYLLADTAWARWSAGHAEEARSALERLSRDHPGVASIEDCLSIVYLAAGDLAGYARHLRRRAEDRGAPALIAYAGLVDAAVARNDRHEAYWLVLTRALNVADTTTRPDHSFAAFVAATFGDRNEVDALMRGAIADGERWGSAGYRRRILSRWPNDTALAATMRRLAMPSLNTPGPATTVQPPII